MRVMSWALHWRAGRRLNLVLLIGRRVLQAILTALGASILIWALLPFAPGDPALRILQAQGREDPDPILIAQMRQEMGLDQPLPLQYIAWLGRVVQGDLSYSYRTGKPVLAELLLRLPATLYLLGVALAIALLLAVGAALLAVATHDRWPDRLIRAFTQVGASLPTFLLGLITLQYVVVGAKFGQVLSGGATGQVLLPALCLAGIKAAFWTQLLRANMLETLGANYVLVAQARGAHKVRRLLHYVLPNAALPLLTALGVSIGAMLGGAPIIEEIFTWPGIGRHVLQAISARDFPVVQGFILLSGLSYVTASLLVDLVTMWVDPRLRERGRV
jgi:ABC-type dipeptide/oligopeptide/nickel transport system permease component